ncbi:hypothetical protein KBY70_03560 [Cyanobium sp. ATX 6E8]|uniref:hypothetical protein n=1 Tax=Cyanobium sp. ATX 6E8 TaxID=2823701 RepID=UPI0020CB8B8C|nr:hypothetical protein [Cyanobium sp. ATX 6E8]MCP9941481.1 hypothetical protein [Cyanobium sp. ATX 6E8]
MADMVLSAIHKSSITTFAAKISMIYSSLKLRLNLLRFGLPYILSAGIIGKGIDVTQSYIKAPNSIWTPADFIGGLASTLTISGIYVGVYVVSFLLLFSISQFYFSNATKYPILFSALALLSWPCFLGATNTLRQGMALAVFVLLLNYRSSLMDLNLKSKQLIYKHISISSLLLFILYFTHQFGRMLAGAYCIALVVNFVSRKLQFINQYLRLLALSILGLFAGNSINASNYDRYVGFENSFNVSYALIIFFLLFNALIFSYPSYRNLLFSRPVIFIIFEIAWFSLGVSLSPLMISSSILQERVAWILALTMILTTPCLISFKIKADFIIVPFIYTAFCMLSLAFVGFKNI